MAFKQLFVKNYGGEDEDDYSASVFTQQDFYDSVSYVMGQVVPARTPPAVWFETGWGGGGDLLHVACMLPAFFWGCLQRSYRILHRASIKIC